MSGFFVTIVIHTVLKYEFELRFISQLIFIKTYVHRSMNQTVMMDPRELQLYI